MVGYALCVVRGMFGGEGNLHLTRSKVGHKWPGGNVDGWW